MQMPVINASVGRTSGRGFAGGVGLASSCFLATGTGFASGCSGMEAGGCGCFFGRVTTPITMASPSSTTIATTAYTRPTIFVSHPTIATIAAPPTRTACTTFQTCDDPNTGKPTARDDLNIGPAHSESSLDQFEKRRVRSPPARPAVPAVRDGF